MYYYCFFLVSLVLYVWGYPHYILCMYWLICVLLAPLVVMRVDGYLGPYIWGYSAIPQTRGCFFIFTLQIMSLHIFIGILKKRNGE